MNRNNEKFYLAQKLRKSGQSYNEINRRTGVAKSTLSGWLKDVELSQEQKEILKNKHKKGLELARVHAAKANRELTRKKFLVATSNAKKIVKDLGGLINKKSLMKLFLAGLYLGDGAKDKSFVCLANSDPQICRAFVILLRKSYQIDESKFRCHLHVRADQNIETLIKYWSTTLKIKPKQFHKTQIDKRTVGTASWEHYRGVCAIYYYDAKIQKEILSLGRVSLESLLDEDN
ncbi:MAG: hypothetical protein A2469_01710 [Candidatus Magasanikbacteria bacterium RIFOXYC2_FULL_40_16]|uniref:Uncharacterized protein n=3 Tax=Candidatus Magasanikiibacteriota TaxID=1752731 RepID=A0A1F6NI00_9BACT|nr:MAG: hypothetical protein A2373_02030 [Candidatus Magasanikbacteria bacterium RIFOXYB1_FULL_40_15]OGH85948.1 MAG: hypothetical protein A2301_00785 [Candidatus Magasanikbacteria bacterium RIFOXYB2_FULL_40_13]OGH87946.1 MAG: hypothetical protein A2206_02890 [Candidatus Magasanikbacteria bacterium RIFOXYA1_FULL_40_8]OGH89312.1 MAG: hypothetical protein A2469_01710 [Candidatus Magasanikbacteria bacterium RIFOXYC2_FULL_40_16]